MKKIEYAIRAITTKKAFPKFFTSEEEAENNRRRHTNPDHWEIVRREVEYGEWEKV